MPYVNIPDSFLSSDIARLVGPVQGKLETEALTSTSRLLEEFSTDDICSNTSRLEQLSKASNNIDRSVVRLSNRLDRLRKVVRPLKTSISAFESIIRVVERIPIPQSVPPGFGIPINVTLKFVKILEKSKEFVKQTNDDIEAIELIAASNSSVQSTLNSINNNSSRIDQAIRRCKELRERGLLEEKRRDALREQIRNLNEENLSYNDVRLVNTSVGQVFLRPGQGLPEGVESLQGEVNTIRGNERSINQEYLGLGINQEEQKLRNVNDTDQISRAGLEESEFVSTNLSNNFQEDELVQSKVSSLNQSIPNFTDPNGREYRFEVELVTSDNIAPLRLVKAFDVISNRLVITGEKSFSSSVDVLVDEVKFRILEELN